MREIKAAEVVVGGGGGEGGGGGGLAWLRKVGERGNWGNCDVHTY